MINSKNRAKWQCPIVKHWEVSTNSAIEAATIKKKRRKNNKTNFWEIFVFKKSQKSTSCRLHSSLHILGHFTNVL